jgi:DNA replication protein DnaC
MELTHQLTPQLKHLRLSGILESLEVRHRQAIDNKWSHIEFLEHLLQDEVERRGQKQLHLRLRRATLNTTKTLETFDFAFNPTLNRQQLLALATGDYIREKRNVILCGPTGVGKSHLSQALGQEACRRGFDVLFINAYKMLQYLHGGRADGSLDRRLKTFLRPDLLILDDFGLKPLQAPAPSDLYDVISERYEKGSLLLTSNRPPAEWPGLFGDPLLAAAGIDRLCHRAEIIIMRGQSFRAQNRQPVGGEEPAGGQPNG